MKYLKLTDAELIFTLKTKTQIERNLTVEIIELLIEVERRKIYLEMGFGNLLDFCIQELKYSESSAYRRIAAARLMQEIPEIKESLSVGTLNIASVAQAQTFIQREKKYNHKSYSTEEKREFISGLENKSKRECEVIFAKIAPEMPKPEKVRPISEDKIEITLVVDQKLLKKLDELKFKYSHQKPGANYSEIIEAMADQLLKVELKRNGPIEQGGDSIKQSMKSNNQRAKSNNQVLSNEFEFTGINATPPGGVALANKKPKVKSLSRYVSAKTKRLAYQEAQGCCSFVDLKTNRKCSSRFQLEYDHKYPLSLGGENTPENIRLLCRQHNQFYWRNLDL